MRLLIVIFKVFFYYSETVFIRLALVYVFFSEESYERQVQRSFLILQSFLHSDEHGWWWPGCQWRGTISVLINFYHISPSQTQPGKSFPALHRWTADPASSTHWWWSCSQEWWTETVECIPVLRHQTPFCSYHTNNFQPEQTKQKIYLCILFCANCIVIHYIIFFWNKSKLSQNLESQWIEFFFLNNFLHKLWRQVPLLIITLSEALHELLLLQEKIKLSLIIVFLVLRGWGCYILC